MTITLLHSAEAHRATFDALPGVALVHIVRPDFLERAQSGIDDVLADEIIGVVSRGFGPVLCTCTTIGPVAAQAGALRIDWPMMQAAARRGGPVLLVCCLDSTRTPSLDLLATALHEAGNPGPVQILLLSDLWPLFTSGQTDDFHRAIAGVIRTAAAQPSDVKCVILAQASMAGAAPLLDDLGIPVLASPESALRAALARL